MNSQEKALARILFQNKVYKSDGQAYEDLFTTIMSYSNESFRKIKAWGKIGDRKNDGYIESKGIYFQVYAPEDIENNYTRTIAKINNDFSGLYEQWKSIKEYYFVLNDKFKGVSPDSEQTLKNIKKQYSLKECGFITSSDLENLLFALDSDKISAVVGFLPNPDLLHLDYSILNETVDYIMNLPLRPIEGEIKFPDWDEKISFNKLTEYPTYLLNHGSHQLGALNNYLIHNETLAHDLQKQITGIYESIKKEWATLPTKTDNVFWEVVARCSFKNKQQYQNAVITIMAKYFESCDIFEEPLKD